MNKWRIEIAELSSSSVLNRITVEASNWINALREGRKSIGDVAEVPQGASCTILPSGIVTILDPLSRRKFTLTKENEIVAQKVISVAPPPISKPVRKSEPPIIALKPTRKSQPPKATSATARKSQPPTAASDPAPKRDSVKPVRTKSVSDRPRSTAASDPAPKRDSVKPVRTKSVSDRPRSGTRESVIESLRRAGFPSKEDKQKQNEVNAPTKPNTEAEKPALIAQEPQKRKPVMQKTVSYVLDPEVRKQIKSVAVGNKVLEASEQPQYKANTISEPQRLDAIATPANRPEKPLGDLPSAPGPNQENQIPFASTEETQPIAENRSEPLAAETKPSILSTYGLELLLERNEEPNNENPLTYRERCFVIPEGISSTDVEAALREQVAILQDELFDAPKGKFVNLAAFDHRWSEQPNRPPIAVLQWKDWRGDPQVEFLESSESATSQAPTTGDRNSTLEDTFEALHELQFLNTAAEGLEFVMKLLQEAVPAEASSACLYDINTHELRFVVVSGPGADQRKGEAVPLTLGLFGQAAKNYDVPTIVADVSANPHFDPEVDSRPDLAANNIIYRPLALNEQLLGMLQLINRIHQPQFSKQDVNLLNYVADQLSHFIHSSRMKPEKESE